MAQTRFRGDFRSYPFVLLEIRVRFGLFFQRNTVGIFQRATQMAIKGPVPPGVAAPAIAVNTLFP